MPKSKVKSASLSIISNSLLVILKLVVGLYSGSVAIISEALHSTLDLFASFIAWLAVKISDIPPDQSHPYGHGKIENLAALFEALLIIVAGLAIVKHSISSFIEPTALSMPIWGAIVMLISAATNMLVSMYLFKVGRRVDSPALIANAWHLRTDVYTSFGVFLGLLIIILVGIFKPNINIHFIDPLCALAVAFLILKTGFSLMWEAGTNLMDQSLSAAEVKLIEEHICAVYPDIKGFSGLKSRRSGPFRFIEFNLKVDGNLTVFKAHELGDHVVLSIKEHYPEAKIIYHLEPI